MATQNEGKYPGDVMFYEAPAGYSRKRVTILSGAGVIAIGHVLGLISASGKYKPATNTGSDGGQLAAAVAIESVDATSGDKPCWVLVRHAIVRQQELVFGATIDDQTKRNTALAQLEAAGIVARLEA